MAIEEEDHATVAVRNPSDRFDRPVEIKRSRSDSIDGVDSISDLPDAVLQHIFSYIPTKFAIRTSVLSRRWRHVWSETPHLSFKWLSVSPESVNKTLASYKASKITSFHLCTRLAITAHHVNSWLEFARSHNVDDIFLEFRGYIITTNYSFPDFFYNNSSLKNLIIDSRCNEMIPRCTVSWTSLKYLDLSKSLHLRILDIDFSCFFRGPIKIVAPHIHYLRLRNSEAQCTLVDVSSLTEAKVDFSYIEPGCCYYSFQLLKPDVLQGIVQAMLEKFQNVEKLTFGVNFLQILSLAKIPSPALPSLKVKTLTLETRIMRSVVPGIARLLQNSPGLKKITVYTTKKCSTIVETCVNSYLDAQDLNPDQCWRLNDVVFPTSSKSEVVKPELMASFLELLLANTRTLETLVLHLGSCIDRSRFEELMTGDSIAGADFISALPDAILHLIFSRFPTKFVIRTSVLSKRWRHVWSDTPSLSIDCREADPNSLIKTLANHSAPRITSFDLCISSKAHDINRLIEFAISRNTEKLSLDFRDGNYNFPEFFYTNSSLNQLVVDSGALVTTIHHVSWTSLRDLSLSFCKLSDESLAMIISGSPLLESLTLHHCDKLGILDLSKSLKLKRLDLDNQGPTQILAPHIHCLRLRHSQSQCGLVDVSSLTEAYLNIYCTSFYHFKSDLLQVYVLNMLEKLHNVENLTFGAAFLQMLSLAEICDIPFPMLKVEVLTLETMIVPSVIPGIAKLLQNSPGLKMLKPLF
ncbi:F-box-like domain superfamily [Arabidopsis suecica]|uniref:F-box-like domain superfamily n=1 Tax=Arabidopsis suecica TaxID=45249 RepID=A0A8T1Z4P9_ARASU|nr:F-box-like domain superfamily [Arabidopsis suecica]